MKWINIAIHTTHTRLDKHSPTFVAMGGYRYLLFGDCIKFDAFIANNIIIRHCI